MHCIPHVPAGCRTVQRRRSGGIQPFSVAQDAAPSSSLHPASCSHCTQPATGLPPSPLIDVGLAGSCPLPAVLQTLAWLCLACHAPGRRCDAPSCAPLPPRSARGHTATFGTLPAPCHWFRLLKMVGSAWTAFAGRLQTEHSTDVNEIIGCSEADLDNILQDMGYAALQRAKIKTTWQSMRASQPHLNPSYPHGNPCGMPTPPPVQYTDM
eukprot:gene2966-3538_t